MLYRMVSQLHVTKNGNSSSSDKRKLIMETQLKPDKCLLILIDIIGGLTLTTSPDKLYDDHKFLAFKSGIV